jgi:hypothetical protein
MRLLRALAGSLLWILSGVLGLVGVLLCVTVLLLPLGIPVLALARKLFRYSMVFFLPRKVRHPAQELGKSVRGSAKDAAGAVSVPELPSRRARKKARKKTRKKAGKVAARTRKKAGKAAKRTREKVGA